MKVVVGASTFAEAGTDALDILSKKGLQVVKNPYRRRMSEEEIIDAIKDLPKLRIVYADLADFKNAKANEGNAGYTTEERGKMTELLAAGFTDSFRLLYPERTDAYTWWSYMGRAREKNIGWRIDYWIVSNRIANRVKDVVIHSEIMGSDHCPVELIIDL